MRPAAYRVWTRDRRFTRGIFDAAATTPEDLKMWEAEGDVVEPLYTEPEVARLAPRCISTEVATLSKALAEAIEEIRFWGQYADELFQDKYELHETLARLRAVLLAAGGSIE